MVDNIFPFSIRFKPSYSREASVSSNDSGISSASESMSTSRSESRDMSRSESRDVCDLVCSMTLELKPATPSLGTIILWF